MHRSTACPTMSELVFSEPCDVQSDGFPFDFNAILRLSSYDSFPAKSLPQLQYYCYSRDQFVCPFGIVCLPSQPQFGHFSTWKMSERCTREERREPCLHTANAAHQVPDSSHDCRLTQGVTSTDESRLISNQRKGKSAGPRDGHGLG